VNASQRLMVAVPWPFFAHPIPSDYARHFYHALSEGHVLLSDEPPPHDCVPRCETRRPSDESSTVCKCGRYVIVWDEILAGAK
jgi:hypothetical protein